MVTIFLDSAWLHLISISGISITIAKDIDGYQKLYTGLK